MEEINSNKNGSGIGPLPMANWNYDWEGDDFKMVGTNKLIIYQIYMGSFFGEISSDGHNFIDVDKKLAYLKILGINAMELILESFRTGSDSDKKGAEDSLTMDQGKYRSIAFANLVKKAHAHGIGVIMVVDFLHIGPGYIDVWKLYGWPENIKEDFFYDSRLHVSAGRDTIPDFDRPDVRQFMRYYVLMWLEKYHCDGVRVKGTDFIRNASGGDGNLEHGLQLVKEINGEIKTAYPNKLLIAEDNGKEGFVIEPLVSRGLGFDIQWDPLFFHNIRFVLTQAKDEDRALQCIVDALAHSYGNDPFSRVVYCESDTEMAKGMPRLPEEIHPGRADSPYAIKRSILGAVLTLTAPGIPLFYQGQEFIRPTFFVGNGRPDWERMSHLHGVQQLFGDLIKLRKSDYNDYAGLQGNQLDFLHFNQQDNILAYLRGHPDHSEHRVMVVINLSYMDYEKYVIGLPEKGKWKLVFNSSSKLYDDNGTLLPIKDFMTKEKAYDGLPYQGSFPLPCYSALLFTHYNTGSRDKYKRPRTNKKMEHTEPNFMPPSRKPTVGPVARDYGI